MKTNKFSKYLLLLVLISFQLSTVTPAAPRYPKPKKTINKKPNPDYQEELRSQDFIEDCFSCTINNFQFCGEWFKPGIRTYCFPVIAPVFCMRTVGKTTTDCGNKIINP